MTRRGLARVGGSDGKAGLDAKLGVSPTLTADLTLNTDFAQVEADQQVINLTRFPTFFPEKREFFLESSGLFDFGTPERAQLFYSRRIGLDANGVPVPILGGARMYGKAGPWSLGVLDARTGGGEKANDVAIRVGHDLFDRSTIAAMVVDRRDRAASPSAAPARSRLSRSSSRGHNVEPHVLADGNAHERPRRERRSRGESRPTTRTICSTTSSRCIASTPDSRRRWASCGAPASGRPPDTSTSCRVPASSAFANSI